MAFLRTPPATLPKTTLLLRNFNAPKLCNGTRLAVKNRRRPFGRIDPKYSPFGRGFSQLKLPFGRIDVHHLKI
jgi:hypothetical protein